MLEGKYKATPETIRKILEVISQGGSQRDASALAGISEDTLSLWKRENLEFSEQIRQKEVEFKMKHVKNITEASKKHWTASAWFLERKYKEEYSKQDIQDVTLRTNISTVLDELEEISK